MLAAFDLIRSHSQARLELEEDHKETIAQMERKFFEEKGRLQKEYKQMLAEMKKSSQEEVHACSACVFFCQELCRVLPCFCLTFCI